MYSSFLRSVVLQDPFLALTFHRWQYTISTRIESVNEVFTGVKNWYQITFVCYNIKNPSREVWRVFINKITSAFEGRGYSNMLKKGFLLLPLNSSIGFWRKVVADAVYVGHFLEDAVGNLVEDCPIDVLDRSCHRVDSVHGADDYGPVV